MRHQRVIIVEVNRDGILDTKGVPSGADVLEGGGRARLWDLEREVPQVLPRRHLSATELEKALVQFEYQIAANLLVFSENYTVLFNELLSTDLTIGVPAKDVCPSARLVAILGLLVDWDRDAFIRLIFNSIDDSNLVAFLRV